MDITVYPIICNINIYIYSIIYIIMLNPSMVCQRIVLEFHGLSPYSEVYHGIPTKK